MCGSGAGDDSTCKPHPYRVLARLCHNNTIFCTFSATFSVSFSSFFVVYILSLSPLSLSLSQCRSFQQNNAYVNKWQRFKRRDRQCLRLYGIHDTTTKHTRARLTVHHIYYSFLPLSTFSFIIHIRFNSVNVLSTLHLNCSLKSHVCDPWSDCVQRHTNTLPWTLFCVCARAHTLVPLNSAAAAATRVPT